MLISLLPSPVRAFLEHRNAVQVSAWTFVILITFVILSSGVGGWLLRGQVTDQWRHQTEALSTSVAEQTAAVFTTADAALAEVAREASRAARSPEGLASERFNELLRIGTRSSSWIELLSVVGLDGQVVNNSRSYPPPQFSVADRDYVRALIERPEMERFIGRPVRNRANGGWTFYMSRRVLDADGRPIAIAVIGMSSAAISEHFKIQALAGGMTISLYGDDWTLLTRYPYEPALVGKVNKAGSEGGEPTGEAQLVNRPRFVNGEQVTRLTSARRVPKFPLIVNVSVVEDVFLATWRRAVTMIALVTLVSSIALVFAMLVVANLLYRREVTIRTVTALNDAAKKTDAQRQELIDELESFSYSISHDLRAPLRAVHGYSELLEDSLGAKLQPEEGRMLREIKRNAMHMSSLIDDLLSIAHVSATPPHLAALDLSELGRDVVQQLRESEPDREVDVRIADGMRATGDASYLRLALANLLGNAWKYTRGTDAPRVEFAQREDGAFYIADNGVGFDAGEASNLFKPFQRLHREEEFEGNGIGLATVQRVIQRHHGGRVWFEAAKGKGATFFFVLPSPAANAKK